MSKFPEHEGAQTFPKNVLLNNIIKSIFKLIHREYFDTVQCAQ